MKINCHCGATIPDLTDGQPHKAHFIPDQDWWELREAIDSAIEKSGPSPRQKEAACMQLSTLLSRLSRQAWQCLDCGRVYLEQHDRSLQEFMPGSEAVTKELFRSRP
ncbi:MAG: hypothetical protein JWN70_3518 [Planctomycetaceae bacterium]|nr:hypothetical protein [Planctomycetaceae bacterium]